MIFMSETKRDWSGWVRTGVGILVMLGGMYGFYERRHNELEAEVIRLSSSFKSHCSNAKMYAIEDLEQRFVLRREWEASRREWTHLREDIKELSRKIDAIYDKLTVSKISQKNNS
jgi:hypothetical protein